MQVTVLLILVGFTVYASFGAAASTDVHANVRKCVQSVSFAQTVVLRFPRFPICWNIGRKLLYIGRRTLLLLRSTRGGAPLLAICSGIFAMAAVALVFCAEHLRDTLFIRPHPAFWRFVTGVGLLYAMFFAYLLFQDVGSIRTSILPLLDPSVPGKQPKQKPYGDKCELWPPAVGYENIKV